MLTSTMSMPKLSFLSTGLLIVMLFIDRVGRIRTLVVGFGCTSVLFVLLMLCNGE